MRVEASCGVIPFRRAGGTVEFLLLHSILVRNPDAAWEFPKGSREADETEVEAALRELREETGVTAVDLLPDFRDVVQYQYRRDGKEISKSVTFFCGEVRDWSSLPGAAPTREHGPHPKERNWYCWVGETQAQRLLFHPGMRNLLQRTARFIHEHDRIHGRRA